MAINFPSSPTQGTTHIDANGQLWTYNGTSWVATDDDTISTPSNYTVGTGKDFTTFQEALDWYYQQDFGEGLRIQFTLDDGTHEITEQTSEYLGAITSPNSSLAIIGTTEVGTIITVPIAFTGYLFNAMATYLYFYHVTLDYTANGATAGSFSGRALGSSTAYISSSTVKNMNLSIDSGSTLVTQDSTFDNCEITVKNGSTAYLQNGDIKNITGTALTVDRNSQIVEDAVTFTTVTTEYSHPINEVQPDGCLISDDTVSLANAVPQLATDTQSNNTFWGDTASSVYNPLKYKDETGSSELVSTFGSDFTTESTEIIDITVGAGMDFTTIMDALNWYYRQTFAPNASVQFWLEVGTHELDLPEVDSIAPIRQVGGYFTIRGTSPNQATTILTMKSTLTGHMFYMINCGTSFIDLTIDYTYNGATPASTGYGFSLNGSSYFLGAQIKNLGIGCSDGGTRCLYTDFTNVSITSSNNHYFHFAGAVTINDLTTVPALTVQLGGVIRATGITWSNVTTQYATPINEVHYDGAVILDHTQDLIRQTPVMTAAEITATASNDILWRDSASPYALHYKNNTGVDKKIPLTDPDDELPLVIDGDLRFNGGTGSSLSINTGYDSAAVSGAGSITIGENAGAGRSTSALYNVIIGDQTVLGTSGVFTGDNCVILGSSNANNATTMIPAVIIGQNVADNCTSTNDLIAIGHDIAGNGLTPLTGNNNIFLGDWVASDMEGNSGSNVYIGVEAARYRTGGSSNIGIGVNAMQGTSALAGQTGGTNIGIGHNAGRDITTGATNVCIGSNAGAVWKTNSTDIAIGSVAGCYNGTTGSTSSGGNNISIGSNSGCNNISSAHTITMGYRAGYNATAVATGNYNIIMGSNSAQDLTTCATSIFIGYQAGRYATAPSTSVCIGSSAGIRMIGVTNIAIGSLAGSDTVGTSNVMIGTSAGENCETNTNVLIGSTAGARMITGNTNIAIGSTAGDDHYGDSNIMMGTGAGSDAGGSTSIMIGSASGKYSHASYLIAIGANAGLGIIAGKQITGSDNTFIGRNSGHYATTGTYNIGIGYQAYAGSSLGDGSGSSNIAIGYRAAYEITSGASNTIIGNGTATNYTTAASNVVLGHGASIGSNTLGMTGSYNFSAINSSHASLTTGLHNIAIGHSSGQYITSGNYNISFGQGSGQGAVAGRTGDYNLTIHNDAGDNLTSGAHNSLIGYTCGDLITTGSYNFGFGYNALDNVLTGSYNVGIGQLAGPSGSTIERSTSIGYTAEAGSYMECMIGRGTILAGNATAHVDTDRAMVLGIGTATAKDGLIIYKDGKVEIPGDLEVTGSLTAEIGQYYNFTTHTVQVDATANRLANICTLGGSTGGDCITVHIGSNDLDWRTGAVFQIYTGYHNTATAWEVAHPVHGTLDYGGETLELLVQVNVYATTLALRRQAGADVIDVNVGILHQGNRTVTLLDTTTTQARPTVYYKESIPGYGNREVIKAETGTTYAPVFDDNDRHVQCTNASAITVTIPNSVFNIGDEFYITQGGAGQVTINATGTLRYPSGTYQNKTAEQWATVKVRCTGSNIFQLEGQLDPV